MKRLLVLFLLFPFAAMAYPGQVIYSFKTPGNYPAGLTFDGQHLWVSDFRTDKIYELNTKGDVIRSIPSPAYWPMGLAFDGKYLWCADAKGLVPQGG
jgi:sugar lactone lactonase YvrE